MTRRLALVALPALVLAACDATFPWSAGDPPPSAVRLGRASVSFETFPGGRPTQAVPLSVRADVARIGVTGEGGAAYASWLDVSATTTSSGAALVLSVASPPPQAGRYDTVLEVVGLDVSERALGSTRLPVSLDVVALPTVTPVSVDLSWPQGAVPAPAQVALARDPRVVVRDVQLDVPWLAATRSGDVITVASNALTAARPVGVHAAQLSVPVALSSDARTLAVPIVATVGSVLAAPESISFQLTSASTAESLSAVATVTTAVPGGLSFTASADVPWLSATGGATGVEGNLTVEVVTAEVAALANGQHAGTVTLTPTPGTSAPATIAVSLNVALPEVDLVAPSTAWVTRDTKVTIRGRGFAGGATVPVVVGSETVTATVVSDTELRATIPAPTAPGRLAVSVENALGLVRPGGELVVLPSPGYAATSQALPQRFERMVIDSERQAVLFTAYGSQEVRRLRFLDGSWVSDRALVANASGAAVTADGDVLVYSGLFEYSGAQGIVRLDAETLATEGTASFSDAYAVYSLIAPLADGRTMLIDSNQWSTARWYPGFASGPSISVYSPVMLLTRDRRRLLIRPTSVTAYGYNEVIHSFDVGDDVFRLRFKPVGAEATWDVSEDGGRMLDGLDVYDRDYVKLGSVVLPDPIPWVAALSPEGAFVYTMSNVSDAWVLRRTDVRAASGPYAADAAPLPFVLPADQSPLRMRVSEDGTALFLMTFKWNNYAEPTYVFHAVPLG